MTATQDNQRTLLVTGVGGFIAWAGQAYVVDSFGATSAAIGYPTAWLYACAPVSGALMLVFAFEHLLLGPPPPSPDVPAHPAYPGQYPKHHATPDQES